LRETDSDRDSEKEHKLGGEGEAGSCRAGSPTWGSTPGPRDHDPSHPGAPITVLFKYRNFLSRKSGVKPVSKFTLSFETEFSLSWYCSVKLEVNSICNKVQAFKINPFYTGKNSVAFTLHPSDSYRAYFSSAVITLLLYHTINY